MRRKAKLDHAAYTMTQGKGGAAPILYVMKTPNWTIVLTILHVCDHDSNVRRCCVHTVRMLPGRWAPSQTDVDSMVRSSAPVNQPASCMVVDMGAFNLVEFVKTLGMPAPGLSVTGGVHVLQILSHSLADRATMFAPLDGTNKVCS